MDHMNHMEHSTSFMTPEWLLYSLAALFFAGACFYIYRLLNPQAVKAVYGYHDKENEVGHGLCMLAMAGCLAPAFLQLPAMLWTVVLSLAGTWFFIRALTWGRHLAHNKWWYDWAHVGMLFGMALMFQPLPLGAWFTWLQIAFWGWFAGYYLTQIVHDLPSRKAFYIGSDVSHFAMGAVMLLMTVFPAAMMPAHSMGGMHDMPGPGHEMPGHNMPGHDMSGHQHQPAAAVKQGNTYVLNDSNFNQEVVAAAKPVVVLVFGGCEKCAQEVRVFDELAGSLAGQAKFVRISKDESPDACKRLGVSDCPRIIIVTEKGMIPAPADLDVTDPQQVRSFIANQIK